jgi:hypothetical protein
MHLMDSRLRRLTDRVAGVGHEFVHADDQGASRFRCVADEVVGEEIAIDPSLWCRDTGSNAPSTA